jgi:hypothetical protein
MLRWQPLRRQRHGLRVRIERHVLERLVRHLRRAESALLRRLVLHDGQLHM